MGSHKNNPNDFSELNLDQLQRYVNRWVSDYQNIAFERITLYHYSPGKKQKIYKDVFPLKERISTKFALVFDIAGIDEDKYEDFNQYKMGRRNENPISDDEIESYSAYGEFRYNTEYYSTIKSNPRYAGFIDSGFECVYKDTTDKDFDGDWLFVPNTSNMELQSHILIDEPSWILYPISQNFERVSLIAKNHLEKPDGSQLYVLELMSWGVEKDICKNNDKLDSDQLKNVIVKLYKEQPEYVMELLWIRDIDRGSGVIEQSMRSNFFDENGATIKRHTLPIKAREYASIDLLMRLKSIVNITGYPDNDIQTALQKLHEFEDIENKKSEIIFKHYAEVLDELQEQEKLIPSTSKDITDRRKRINELETLLKTSVPEEVLNRGKRPLNNISQDEVIELRPNFFGIGLNLRALWRWFVKFIKRKKTDLC